MSVRLRSLTAAAAVIISALLVISGCSTDSAGRDAQTGTENGYVGHDQQLTRVPVAKRVKAPVISGPSLTDGKTIDSADYAGKVLVINVWGSWCPPCRKEAPDLQTASDKLGAKAQFIGINSRDPAKAAPQAFLRAHKITYPSIYDPDGSQVVKFDNLPPSAIPSTLVIDEQGRLAVRILGTISTDTLVDIVDDVAAGK
ncbi:TlpA disulfide reductase family protein [Microlunatus sp. Gsoil 973]|jgi:thiol-disulfide isomerase/thioredoxin|uniref:TlpA family protein disulfide reductase n=1 Tax=Microlunatus sp. Gsoil 973 TaxID=2672569 RepID=UPI0012B4FA29|nr:TlpA disulfide reductase family protein [Microlunatus sp. Gsoil 973]QGN33804.1 redoxin domain-containing protein [Microlunatus sp. Gsoil 973]